MQKMKKNNFFVVFIGKARRLKQAKDEATEEIEKYRAEREKQFKDFEAKVGSDFDFEWKLTAIFFSCFFSSQQHMGSREGVASKIEIDTQAKLQEMLRQLNTTKEPVIQAVLDYIYDIQVELHKNYRDDL